MCFSLDGEEGSVVMTVEWCLQVTYFAVEEKERCDQFGRDLNQMVPVKNLGELRWYSGCFCERDWAKGVLTISQQTFSEQLAHEYGAEYGRSVPMPVDTKLGIFDKDEASGG